MVIRKACAPGDRDAAISKGREKLFRIGDAGEGEHFASAHRGKGVAVRLKATVKQNGIVTGRARDHCRRRDIGANENDRLSARNLHFERRPQRTRRNDVAVADAAPVVDQQDRKFFASAGF